MAMSKVSKWAEIEIGEDLDYLDEFDFSQQKEEKSDGYSHEQEAELKGFARRFHGDVKGLVKQYIEQFFKDKMMHCGGKIPAKMLLSERRISLVLNYDIIRGVDRAYAHLECLLSKKDHELAKGNGEVTSDIKLVTEVLNLLSRSFIPQQFAGGMLLLYLEFIEGVDIGTYP